MSIHKSFKTNRFGQKRSVRKRWERIRSLMLQEKWEKSQSVYNLPTEKRIFKIKKTEEQKAKEAEVKDLTLAVTETPKKSK